MTELNPIVTLKIKNSGSLKIELYPEIAPNTVRNFISLVDKKFYDGLTFHRVIPGFMIQGGCPDGLGTGGPGYGIKGEFKSNGFKNDLKHTKGVLSMARSQNNDSAGSQFFIMVSNSPHLDGEYAAFGKVIEGMDFADAVVSVTRDRGDKPLEPQIIESMIVENADNIEEPEKM
jgi:peptidyl-prolyl cis-trans isomerase B (cyclophilin B)